VSQGLSPSGFSASDREKERVGKRTGGSRRHGGASERQGHGEMERGGGGSCGGEKRRYRKQRKITHQNQTILFYVTESSFLTTIKKTSM